jgi:hypothetical protein
VADEQNPETIERDIERTQDAIGDTVEKLEQKLTPREFTRSILGDDGQEVMREGIRLVRENPIPAAMIVVGAIWLFATSRSPLLGRVGERLSSAVRGNRGDDKLRPRSEEPAPIGPPPAQGEEFDRRSASTS